MPKRIIVELEKGVWLAPWDGDPGRTVVKDNAQEFMSRSSAKRSLKESEKIRAFKNPKLILIEK